MWSHVQRLFVFACLRPAAASSEGLSEGAKNRMADLVQVMLAVEEPGRPVKPGKVWKECVQSLLGRSEAPEEPCGAVGVTPETRRRVRSLLNLLEAEDAPLLELLEPNSPAEEHRMSRKRSREESTEEERSQAIGILLLLALAGCGIVALLDRIMFPKDALRGGPCWCRICAGEIKVGRMLGEGGGGRVFTCSLQGKLRVVKMININIDQDINALGDALEEAKNLIELRHKHIVSFYDFFFHRGEEVEEGKCADNVCIVMEYCDGGSLLDHISDGVPLPFDVLITAFYQVVEALAHVHKQRMIHFDVKLENIFLTSSIDDQRRRKRRGRRQWHLKVGDFGLAVQNQGIYNPKPKTRSKRRRREQRAPLPSIFVADTLRKPRQWLRRKIDAEHKAEPESETSGSPSVSLSADSPSDSPANSHMQIDKAAKKAYRKSAVVGGTAPYQAPECFDGTPSEQLTAKVDSWALGCALYEAVTCTSLHLEEPYVGQLALGSEEWRLLQDEIATKFHLSLRSMLTTAAAEKLSVTAKRRKERQDERLRAAFGLEELLFGLLQPNPQNRPDLREVRSRRWWTPFKTRPIYLPSKGKPATEEANSPGSVDGGVSQSIQTLQRTNEASPNEAFDTSSPRDGHMIDGMPQMMARAKSMVASPFTGMDWDLRPASIANLNYHPDRQAAAERGAEVTKVFEVANQFDVFAASESTSDEDSSDDESEVDGTLQSGVVN